MSRPFGTTMNTIRANLRRLFQNAVAAAILPVAFGLPAVLMSGCATGSLDPGLTGPFHRPSNFNLTDSTLPEDVRRIAVLPLATSRPSEITLGAGRNSLQPVLYDEILKSRLFEAIAVSEEQMAQWTGKKIWRQDEVLPADFIVRIEDQTACDAILFCELTSFSAYPPLAIGWKFLLVKTDGQVLWSFDDIFDAGEPQVANSARRFEYDRERSRFELLQQSDQRSGSVWQYRVAGSDSVDSPTHFGKYTVNAAFRTLAGR